MALDDPALKERLAAAKEARRQAQEEVTLTATANTTGNPAITPAKIRRLASAMNDVLRSNDAGFRKAYIRLFFARIIVADREIRISGPNKALERAAASDDRPSTADIGAQFRPGWRISEGGARRRFAE